MSMRIAVGTGSCGIAAGAGKLLDALAPLLEGSGRLLGTVTDGQEKMKIYAAKGTERYVIADDGSQSALYERIETMPPAVSTERSEP